MTEGLKLDIKITEEVMGYPLCTKTFHSQLDPTVTYYHVSGGDVEIIECINDKWRQYIFSPSTYIYDAMIIAERFDFYTIEKISGYGDEFKRVTLAVAQEDGTYEDVEARAETVPMAICIAALRGFGIDI